MKRISKLVGSSIEAMKEVARLKSELSMYFYVDSRFSKALRDYIQGMKDLPIELPYEDCRLSYPRGQSPVTIRETQAGNDDYRNIGGTIQRVESDVFQMTISVLFSSEEYGEEHADDTFEKHYTLWVPVALEDDSLSDEEFKRQFMIWVMEQNAKIVKERREADLQILKKLARLYPEEAVTFAG